MTYLLDYPKTELQWMRTNAACSKLMAKDILCKTAKVTIANFKHNKLYYHQNTCFPTGESKARNQLGK